MKASEVIAQVGDFEVEVDEGDVITDVFLVARLQRMDDPPNVSAITLGASASVDEILGRGLLHAALERQNRDD